MQRGKSSESFDFAATPDSLGIPDPFAHLDFDDVGESSCPVTLPGLRSPFPLPAPTDLTAATLNAWIDPVVSLLGTRKTNVKQTTGTATQYREVWVTCARRELVKNPPRSFRASRRTPHYIPEIPMERAIALACERFEKTRAWQEQAVLYRRDLFGRAHALPVAKVTRSWYTDEGRWRQRMHIRSLAHALLELSAEAEGSRERPKMVTLTYGNAFESWFKAEGHVREYVNRVKAYYRTQYSRMSRKRKKAGLHPVGPPKIEYMWFAELQDGKRGDLTNPTMARHIHIVFVGLPWLNLQKAKVGTRKATRQARQSLFAGWWPHGGANVRAVKLPKALNYAMKYAAKLTMKNADDPGNVVFQILSSASCLRRYGYSKNVGQRAKEHRRDRPPYWVDEAVHVAGLCLDSDGSEPMRAVEGYGLSKDGLRGWVDLSGGETLVVHLDGRRWSVVNGCSPGIATLVQDHGLDLRTGELGSDPEAHRAMVICEPRYIPHDAEFQFDEW